MLLMYATSFVKTGKRGRPKREPAKPMTFWYNTRLHQKVVSYCIEYDISQREFFETAAELFMLNQTFKRNLRQKRDERTAAAAAKSVAKVNKR